MRDNQNQKTKKKILGKLWLRHVPQGFVFFCFFLFFLVSFWFFVFFLAFFYEKFGQSLVPSEGLEMNSFWYDIVKTTGANEPDNYLESKFPKTPR